MNRSLYLYDLDVRVVFLRKSDSIDGIWYDTYEIDDIDEIDIQIFLLRAY